MKPIATSTSDFADLIRHGGIYVDKTAYFHRLVSNEMNRLLFLVRPRRFGKSLMNYLKRWDMLTIDPDKTQFITEQEFDVTNLADLKPIGMLFQTGYLTIKDYSDGFYTLSVPDEEVRRDLNILMAWNTTRVTRFAVSQQTE